MKILAIQKEKKKAITQKTLVNHQFSTPNSLRGKKKEYGCENIVTQGCVF